VQSDPIGLASGVSTYGYAYGNPSISTDTYGLAPDPPLHYKPALGPIIVKTPTSPIHWAERIGMSYVVGKMTAGFVSVNETGQLVPKTSTLLGRASVIGYFMQPTEMGCAELDCDGNGIIDFLQNYGMSCEIPRDSLPGT